jgi:nucleotide-binding universal stress UspA family protein
MMVRSPVLCPIDFSQASRGALRYAAAIAEHFYAGLTVATVDDPLLSGATETPYRDDLRASTKGALEQFVTDSFRRLPTVAELYLEVVVGKPATEIARLAEARGADLIVMSTHGRAGLAKMFFGSTTERVLRETRIPVLVTPADDPGPPDVAELQRRIHTVLAPVDLSAASERQIQIAAGLADALQASLVLVHVLEPLSGRPGREATVRAANGERRVLAIERLDDLAGAVTPRPELILTDGDAAAEIAKLARERQIGAVVMGLHSTTALGPRMGSVTYRMLCQTTAPVLALPPSPVATAAAIKKSWRDCVAV